MENPLCPEPVRQIVIINGVEETIRHILTFVTEKKQRAQKACCSYEADEKDIHDLRTAEKQHEILSRACEEFRS